MPARRAQLLSDQSGAIDRSAFREKVNDSLADIPWAVSIPATIVACVYIAIPADFVLIASPIGRLQYAVSAMALAAIAIWATVAIGSKISTVMLAAFVVASLPMLSAIKPQPLTGLYVILPMLVGILAAKYVSPNIILGALVLMAAVFAVELVTHTFWYSNLFGTPRFVSYAISEFRARGVLGQPVPAACVGVTVCAAAFNFFLTSRRPAAALGVAAIWLFTLFSTGTRSAVILSAIALIVIAVGAGSAINIKILKWLLTIAAILIGIQLGLSRFPLGNHRLFSFGKLSDTESGIVRLNAWKSVNGLNDPCRFTCGILGHGARDLQSQLAAHPVDFGLKTVDNQFLTLYWDYGVVGIVSTLALLMYSLNRCVRHNDIRGRCGAIIVALTIISGFFYDSMYVRSSAVVLGLGAGLILVRSHSRPYWGNSE